MEQPIPWGRYALDASARARACGVFAETPDALGAARRAAAVSARLGHAACRRGHGADGEVALLTAKVVRNAIRHVLGRIRARRARSPS